MMLVSTVLSGLMALAYWASSGSASPTVKWDAHSLILDGQRQMIWSGEFHPFRLPAPGLWLDVFQKIKAMGYSAVSFYLYWGLLEGQQGQFRADGVFAIEPFVEAAAQANIYLIARPGPYINSESSGGGFPGWLQRCPDILRSSQAEYLEPALNYTRLVAEILAPYQYTRGGPIIFIQVENEYTFGTLDAAYMQAIQDTYHSNGINVPMSFNDAQPDGNWVAGSGNGSVQIYGSDGYPFGYGSSCANPYSWPENVLPTYLDSYSLHMSQSPSTPFAIMEYEGSQPVGWGGTNQSLCLAEFGAEWENLFYRDIQGNGVKIFNIYMTYGGTNWGGISFPGGITSYDESAVIAEDRTLTREKYSEAKLLATFLQASPAYLTSEPINNPSSSVISSNDSVALYALADTNSTTMFYMLRQSNYSSTKTVHYTLSLPLGNGTITVPQLGGQLTLAGRDARMMVSNYSVGAVKLIYCTADIFSWAGTSASPTIVVYGGAGQVHELALAATAGTPRVFGKQVKVATKGAMMVVQWLVTTQRQVLTFSSGLKIFLLWKNDAYNYWALDAKDTSSQSKTPVIIKAGYLVRNATINGNTISIVGDVNRTTTVELIAAPQGVNQICFNTICGTTAAGHGNPGPTVIIPFHKPSFTLPNLATLQWKYVNSLPEVTPSYNDSLWVACDHTTSNNGVQNLTTPTSLFSGDYGFHVGPFIYRASFVANGQESSFSYTVQGGLGFGYSIWLDDTFIKSMPGTSWATSWGDTVNVQQLTNGTKHTFTIIVDSMGYEMNFVVGSQQMQTPRGVLAYDLTGHPATDLAWRMTGNLGGEAYKDLTRGPMNEGAFYAERQGFHLPGAPISSWKSRSPARGISTAGVAFYVASFSLNLPIGYDIPISVALAQASQAETSNYRVQIFVNGYKMGHYVHNLGPQSEFPVPEGILNYQGQNVIGIMLWAMDGSGAKVQDLHLVATGVVQSGYGSVAASPQTPWTKRIGAY